MRHEERRRRAFVRYIRDDEKQRLGIDMEKIIQIAPDLTRRLKAKFAVPGGSSLTNLLAKPGNHPDLSLDRDLKDVTTSSMEALRACTRRLSPAISSFTRMGVNAGP